VSRDTRYVVDCITSSKNAAASVGSATRSRRPGVGPEDALAIGVDLDRPLTDAQRGPEHDPIRASATIAPAGTNGQGTADSAANQADICR
jgi:hypothetical protein